MTHQEQIEIGAYLLGALPPRGRSRFEQHLARCAACRNEVADLAGIPALLGKVSLAEALSADVTGSDIGAPAPAPAPDLPRIELRPDQPETVEAPGAGLGEPGHARPRVIWLPDAATVDSTRPPPTAQPPATPPPATPPTPTQTQPPPQTQPPQPQLPPQPQPTAGPARKPVTAGPHGWRHGAMLLAAAAVVAVLAAVGALAVVSGRSGPAAGPTTTPVPAPTTSGGSRTVTLTPTVAGVHGSVQIAGSGTGSILRVSMGGVRPGQQCSLLVRGGDGTRHAVATWTASYEGDVEMAATSALQPSGIRWVGVATPDGAVLLQAALAS